MVWSNQNEREKQSRSSTSGGECEAAVTIESRKDIPHWLRWKSHGRKNTVDFNHRRNEVMHISCL